MVKNFFSNVRTEYVKEKIKGRSFSDKDHREYVETLIMIEQYFAGEMKGWTTGYWVKGVKEKLPEEFMEIGEEMKPGFKAGLSKEKKKEAERLRKEEERRAKKEELRVLSEEKDWVKLGGKV